MSIPLTGKQRRYLRALGHSQKPVVQIGHGGLSEPVVKAIDQALERHELVKIKIGGEPGELDATELGQVIAENTRSSVAQIIGHTLLVYRRRNKEPKIQLPETSARKKKRED